MIYVVAPGTPARKNLGTQAMPVEQIKGIRSGNKSFKSLLAPGSETFYVLRSAVVAQQPT